MIDDVRTASFPGHESYDWGLDQPFVRSPRVESEARKHGTYPAMAEYQCSTGGLLGVYLSSSEFEDSAILKRGIFSMLQNGPKPAWHELTTDTGAVPLPVSPAHTAIERDSSGVYAASYVHQGTISRKIITHRDYVRRGAQGTSADATVSAPHGASQLDPHGGAPRTSSVQEADWSAFTAEGALAAHSDSRLPGRVRHTTLVSIPGAGIGGADKQGHGQDEAAGAHDRKDPFFDQDAADAESRRRPSMHWPFAPEHHHERMVRAELRQLSIERIRDGATPHDELDDGRPDYLIQGREPGRGGHHNHRVLLGGGEAAESAGPEDSLVPVPVVPDVARHVELAQEAGEWSQEVISGEDAAEAAAQARAHGGGSRATWHMDEPEDAETSRAQKSSKRTCSLHATSRRIVWLLRSLPVTYHNDSAVQPHVHEHGLSHQDDDARDPLAAAAAADASEDYDLDGLDSEPLSSEGGEPSSDWSDMAPNKVLIYLRNAAQRCPAAVAAAHAALVQDACSRPQLLHSILSDATASAVLGLYDEIVPVASDSDYVKQSADAALNGPSSRCVEAVTRASTMADKSSLSASSRDLMQTISREASMLLPLV